jgi:predicted transposase/invertase (TIGR01784 family)
MFALSDLKQTRFYQEAFEEGREEGIEIGELSGKLVSVPFMLQLGATVEQVAAILNLPLEKVREVAQQSSQS